MKCQFHPASEAEYLEYVGYYESCLPGLGEELIKELEALVNIVADSPQAWKIEIAPGIRRAPLRRFPLSVIYRHISGNIQILAIAHDRRRPQYWLGRLE